MTNIRTNRQYQECTFQCFAQRSIAAMRRQMTTMRAIHKQSQEMKIISILLIS